MNTKDKGNRKEKEVMEIHTGKGYRCEKVRNVPYHHGDLFGVADVLALNNKHLKLIAVTSRPNKSRALKRFKAFGKVPRFIIQEIWLYSSKQKGWEVVAV